LRYTPGAYGGASLALDAAGNPVVVYFHESSTSSGELRLVHCGDANCVTANVFSVLDEGVVSQARGSLALDGSGNPMITYNGTQGGTRSGRLTVLSCGDANCTTGNVSVQPDPLMFSGDDSVLRLDSKGHPVVSYVAYPSFNDTAIKLLHCRSVSCQ
jgi:hypothetical protein